MIKTNKKTKIIFTLILAVLAVIWIMPLFFVVVNIFKSKVEYNLGSLWTMPEGIADVVENFNTVRANKVFASFLSSLMYCGGGAALGVFCSILAGFGLTHTSIRHKNFWFLFIYSGTIFPFEIYLIPVFRAYKATGLYNTRTGMLLFFTALAIPFAMFVIRNTFASISNEICESAKIDGANNWQVLWEIMVPMIKGPISIVLLQQFTACWNNLMFGLTFTKSANIRPVMASLSLLGNRNIPAVFLACIFVSIPTILLFILLRDNIETGFAYTTK